MEAFFNNIVYFFSDIFGWFWDLLADFASMLLGGLGSIISSFIDSVNLTMEIPESIYTTLREITIGVGYIIPLRALLPIPTLMILFYISKMVYAVFHLVFSTIIQHVKLPVPGGH